MLYFTIDSEAKMRGCNPSKEYTSNTEGYSSYTYLPKSYPYSNDYTVNYDSIGNTFVVGHQIKKPVHKYNC